MIARHLRLLIGSALLCALVLGAVATPVVRAQAPTLSIEAHVEKDKLWWASIGPFGTYALSIGQTSTHTFTLTAELARTRHWVSGSFTVHNPGPSVLTLETWDVTVATSGLYASILHEWVYCGGDNAVPAGGSLVCYFGTTEYDPAELSFGTLIEVAVAGSSDGGAWSANGSAYLDPTPTVDRFGTVRVEISGLGDMGWVAENATASWNFTKEYGCPADPRLYTGGTYTYYDQVSMSLVSGEDTADSAGAVVEVTCSGLVENCTLGAGYWETHSSEGPAAFDLVWDELGEWTSFFHSDKNYLEVLKTKPAGNAYYILAAQYIAAELNFLNGADPSAAQAAFDQATDWFSGVYPEIGLPKVDEEARKQLLALADTLERYDSGRIGPGRCK